MATAAIVACDVSSWRPSSIGALHTGCEDGKDRDGVYSPGDRHIHRHPEAHHPKKTQPHSSPLPVVIGTKNIGGPILYEELGRPIGTVCADRYTCDNRTIKCPSWAESTAKLKGSTRRGTPANGMGSAIGCHGGAATTSCGAAHCAIAALALELSRRQSRRDTPVPAVPLSRSSGPLCGVAAGLFCCGGVQSSWRRGR